MRIKTVALCLVVLFCLAACDGFTHIGSRVTDTNGKPIENAQVEMKTGGRDGKVKTGADGSFSIGFSHAPFNVELVVTVSKEGYKTFEKRFSALDASQFPPTINLERAQSAAEIK